MDRVTLLLIVGVVGFLGFLLLLVAAFAMLRDRGSKPRQRSERPSSTAAPPAPAAAAPANPSPGPSAAPAGPPPNELEVLRVLRDRLSGRLVVEIDGRRYTQLAEIKEAAVYQGLLATLRDLQVFARTAPEATAPPAAVAPPAARRVPAADLTVLAGGADESPLPPPSMNPFKQMQVLRELNKTRPEPPKSITEQIDEVLQAKIAGTPLAARGCRVRANAKGGATFELDGKGYESVDELPDPEARATIRAAVADWEKSR